METSIFFAGRGLTGPPLLLVHGFPLDHAMWSPLLDRLGGVARVVAPDLPGFGGSPPMSDGTVAVTMDDYASHVLAVADALGFPRFVLAGLSMGGYIALALARRHASRLAGLVLLDTRAEPDDDAGRQGRLRSAQAVLGGGLATLAAETPAKLLGKSTMARNPAVVEDVRRMIERASPAGVAGALLGMAARPDARAHLGAISVPTLVVVGAEDSVTPASAARTMASAIPAAELAVVPAAGHLAPLEAPEPIAELLRHFLAARVLQP